MMRNDALAALSSNSAHDRLKAVRFLARNCDPSDLEALRNALRVETVSYVRNGLELAIKRISNSYVHEFDTPIEEFEIPPDIKTQIKKETTEEVTGLILHEIASPLGLISSSAAREIPDYEHSKTREYVEHLKCVFDAIEQLKGAAAIPKPDEFDLVDLLEEIITEINESYPIEISLHGVKPMLINSDRILLKLAISNGVRNAVEAVTDAINDEPHPVIVTWGATDVDYWVTVFDRGPGIVGLVESAFGIGKTTKIGHSGFGLTIARQAIETLGGICILQPNEDGGARFEIRWEN